MKLPSSLQRHVIRPNSLETAVTAPIPETALELSDDKRADVLIAMTEVIRNALLFWEERAFHATSWGIGIELSAAAAWILYGKDVTSLSRYLLAMSLLFFGVLTQLYLQAARVGHDSNGLVLVKLEAALKLCDDGAYLKSARFFGYSGAWVKPVAIGSLQVFHIAAVVFTIGVVLWAPPVMNSVQSPLSSSTTTP